MFQKHTPCDQTVVANGGPGDLGWQQRSGIKNSVDWPLSQFTGLYVFSTDSAHFSTYQAKSLPFCNSYSRNPLPRNRNRFFTLGSISKSVLGKALEQQRTPGKGRRHSPVDRVVLVPAPTGSGPGQCLVDVIRIDDKIIHGTLLRHDGFDVLRGNFPDPFDHFSVPQIELLSSVSDRRRSQRLIRKVARGWGEVHRQTY